MIRQSKTYIAIPPGETIKECLEWRGMDYLDMLDVLPMCEATRLLEGRQRLTPEFAEKLEELLGIPAGFWLRLEAVYREKLKLVEEENANEK